VYCSLKSSARRRQTTVVGGFGLRHVQGVQNQHVVVVFGDGDYETFGCYAKTTAAGNLLC